MSGLKTQWIATLDATLQRLDPNSGQPAASGQGVSSILYAFMQYLAANAATYDTTKTLDSNFIVSSKSVVAAATNVQFFNIQYPQSEHFLIMAFRVLTATNATLNSSVWQPGISDGPTMSGVFDVVNNGTIEMKQVPFDNFPLSTNVADQDSGYLPNLKGILLKAQTTLAINATWPSASPPGTNVNMNIQAHGLKLV